jgi:hypothetical protein
MPVQSREMPAQSRVMPGQAQSRTFRAHAIRGHCSGSRAQAIARCEAGAEDASTAIFTLPGNTPKNSSAAVGYPPGVSDARHLPLGAGA